MVQIDINLEDLISWDLYNIKQLKQFFHFMMRKKYEKNVGENTADYRKKFEISFVLFRFDRF